MNNCKNSGKQIKILQLDGEKSYNLFNELIDKNNE